MLTYWLVFMGGIIYSWIKLYEVSSKYDWKCQPMFFQLSRPLWFQERPKDISDVEWNEWNHFARHLFSFYVIHSVLFNLTEKLLSNKIWSAVMFVYWLSGCCMIFSARVVITVILIGVTKYGAMALVQSKMLLRFLTCVFLYMTMDVLPRLLVTSAESYYIVSTFLAYKILQYASYCLDSLESGPKSNEPFCRGVYEMLWYSFYPPYSVYLIVLSKHFKEQLNRRETGNRDFFEVTVFAVRMIFWYMLMNTILHFFYFNAMTVDSQFLDNVPRDVLCALGCAIGQFFHLKYVVIFGLQAAFAKLDNMKPPKGPICVSRLMLYSKLWRYFDRGMYAFFKEYIFLPICRPTFSVPRRLTALFICFVFVICWHGNAHNYIVWVVFNIAEIMLEKFSKAVYDVPSVKTWRERHISDTAFRRILAVLFVVPYTFGLYSNFYFLSTSEAGYIFVKKLFWSDTLHLRYPFLILVFVGYCFGNVLIELEPYFVQMEKSA